MMERFGAESPSVMGGFAQLHEAAVADGVLSAKVRELIALAIGITVRCDGCIGQSAAVARRFSSRSSYSSTTEQR